MLGPMCGLGVHNCVLGVQLSWARGTHLVPGHLFYQGCAFQGVDSGGLREAGVDPLSCGPAWGTLGCTKS